MTQHRQVLNEWGISQSLLESLAKHYGSPYFLYNGDQLISQCQQGQKALDPGDLICFAVKSNSNLALLGLIASEGLGADVVSGGEYQRAVLAGITSDKIVFSGVGKTQDELRYAIQNGVKSINVESLGEWERLEQLASELGIRIPLSLRLNPNVDAQTHPKIATGLYDNKFGLDEEAFFAIVDRLNPLTQGPGLALVGISCHIGSQIMSLDPLQDAARRMREIASVLLGKGWGLEFIDVGGGLGLDYYGNAQPPIHDYIKSVKSELKGLPTAVVFEPGRSLIGRAGLLCAQVIDVKQTGAKNFVIVDAAMTELMRPCLYDAYHHLEVLKSPPNQAGQSHALQLVDVVGPVCESSDVLAHSRMVPAAARGDLVVIGDVGAYGMSMASNYNSRPRPAEVLYHKGKCALIREREELQELWQHEVRLDKVKWHHV